ncbi:AAA family ATPase [Metallosphaera hakonensis]|uniref:ATPase n=1 Tax=Metallosphaera hakonensis JCM 8857 = DSM 7519 TaxID=1293036 RepID=A0A2U9ITI3_9CREN|nr:AAA family ATPase [Metallosphaera hakonensis]AWR99273.1 AAA family ATPase [Metallosphaera hakonensis JCM 8857 = DSM 7519]
MRISILSSKGGVGKSTIAISLSKALSKRGNNVLLIDRDLIGYASYLAGIRGLGMVSSVADGVESTFYREMRFDDGSVVVLKYFGDGPRYKVDIDKFHKDRALGDRGWELYRRVLNLRKYDFVVVDNAPLVRPQDDIVRHELEKFKSVYPGFPVRQLFVSDSLEVTINDNVRYAESIGVVNEKTVLGFVINMIPPRDVEKFRSVLSNIVGRLGARFGILLPFMESIFQFSGEFTDFPIPTEIEDLAEKIQEIQTIKD